MDLAPTCPPRRPADHDLGGISLVLPVHNEVGIIEQTLRTYLAELEGRMVEIEVIVAEDGSTDDTKSVLERLELELPITVFTAKQRKGYQDAVIDAIAHATQPWLFIVDSDYQFAPVDFWRLEPYRRTHDIILDMKSPQRDPVHRIALSRGFNFLLRRLFTVPYRDMDTGFRLVRREVANAIIPHVKQLSTFTAEFVVRAHYEGYRITEVPVAHYARKTGRTMFSSGLFLCMFCIHQFRGALRMRREFKRKGLLP